MSQFTTRQRIIQALYQWQLNDDDINFICAQFTTSAERTKGIDEQKFVQQFKSIVGNVIQIDETFKPFLNRDNFHIGEVERSILRLATFELLFTKETPHKVIIDQALELAKIFNCKESKGFINAVLDQIKIDRTQ